jgi:hypothetical protein
VPLPRKVDHFISGYMVNTPQQLLSHKEADIALLTVPVCDEHLSFREGVL